MFHVAYEFKVKAGCEAPFIEAWRAVTLAFRRYRGALGSRLHRAEDGTYVAYAQWPSEESYGQASVLPEEVVVAQRQLRESCDEIITWKKMSVVDDLLVQESA